LQIPYQNTHITHPSTMASGLILTAIVNGNILTINNATLDDDVEFSGTIKGKNYDNCHITFRSHEHPYYSRDGVSTLQLECEQILIGQMNLGRVIIYVHSHTLDEWNVSIGFGKRFSDLCTGIVLKSIEEPAKGVHDG